MINLYNSVILPSLYNQGYSSDDIKDYGGEYIVTFSPITEDEKTKSALIFKETGILKLLNGSVENKEGEEFTTVTLTTWLRQLNCKLSFYIKYVIFKEDIDKNLMIEYQKYSFDKLMKLRTKYNYLFEKIRKKLYENYILDVDILNLDVSKPLNIKEIESINKPKEIKSKMEILQPTEEELYSINSYIKQRGLNINLKNSVNILPRIILQNSIYRKPALCFAYEKGFFKYRIVFETDKRYRFRSQGRYRDFFIVNIKEGNKILYIVEGEIEALTIKQYLTEDIDIVAIHNTNSFPTDPSVDISKYEKVIVKIDKDRYEENKGVFYKIHKNVIVDYKTEQDNYDYNDLHIKGILTKEKVLNILYNKEV